MADGSSHCGGVEVNKGSFLGGGAVGPYCEVGKPLIKRDCRVSFMDRVPEGVVTFVWDGCDGRRKLRKNCEQRRLK